MPVIFVKNQERDTDLMMEMFFPSTEDADNRAHEAGIPKSVLASARKASSKEGALRIFREYAQARYSEDASVLDTAIKEYREAWDRLDGVFFSEVRRITNTEWQFSEYEVIVSLFHRGISNSNANSVVRWAYDTPEEHPRITAHEILMIQLWYVFDQHFAEAEQDLNGHFWMLNELTAVAILGLDPSLNTLWAPSQRGYDGFLQNYPQLHRYKEKAKQLYTQRDSFLGYLESLLKEMRGEAR